MGDHLPGWSVDLADQLDKLLAQYSPFDQEDRPFRDRVAIEEISYDGVFDRFIQSWGREGARLSQFATDHGITLNGALNGILGGQLPLDVTNFFWETLLDPVLYRSSPLVRDRVRESVTKQFLDKWDHYLTTSTSAAQVNVSVLCHSQGTIVMSDVLAQIGEAHESAFIPFSAEKRTLQCLMTVANVSRLGPPGLIDIDSRESCVRPDNAPPFKAGKNNYLRRFINARHDFDPFCLWQRFEPLTHWGTRYELIDGLQHVHQASTHGLQHYLSHPRVHGPFFRAILGPTSVPKPVEKAAADAFPAFAPPACNAALTTLQGRLSALSALSLREPEALDDFLTNGMAVYRAAREALQACSSLVGGFAGP